VSRPSGTSVNVSATRRRVAGHTTPLLRIKGGEFMSRAVWDVSVPDMTPRCCRRATFQPHHLSVDWNHVSDVK